MKIYGFGGLGVDERVFSTLNPLLKVPITPIRWITPLKEEKLEKYAGRIAEKIDTREEIVLVGVSFGGMVAIEISKIIKVKKLILISSAANRHELPKALKLLTFGGMFQLIPEKYIHPPLSIAKWFFSIKTPESSRLLIEIIKSTDKSFMKWAINAISNWNNQITPEKIIRIHGANDRLIPLKKDLSCLTIENAGHFAIVEDAIAIAQIINNELKDLQ